MIVIPEYDEVKNAFLGIEEAPEEEIDEDDPPFEPDPPKAAPAKEEIKEEVVEEKPRERKRERKQRTPKDTCPSGFEFGTDNNGYDECDDCKVWESCADKYEEMQ